MAVTKVFLMFLGVVLGVTGGAKLFAVAGGEGGDSRCKGLGAGGAESADSVDCRGLWKLQRPFTCLQDARRLFVWRSCWDSFPVLGFIV